MNGQLLFSQLEVNPDFLGINLTNPDPSEVAHYVNRNQILARAIRGEGDPDDYLECLLDQGINVDQFLSHSDDILRPFL